MAATKANNIAEQALEIFQTRPSDLVAVGLPKFPRDELASLLEAVGKREAVTDDRWGRFLVDVGRWDINLRAYNSSRSAASKARNKPAAVEVEPQPVAEVTDKPRRSKKAANEAPPLIPTAENVPDEEATAGSPANPEAVAKLLAATPAEAAQ